MSEHQESRLTEEGYQLTSRDLPEVPGHALAHDLYGTGGDHGVQTLLGVLSCSLME